MKNASMYSYDMHMELVQFVPVMYWQNSGLSLSYQNHRNK